MKSKDCTGCGVHHAIGQFALQKHGLGGRGSRCRGCRKEARDAIPAEVKRAWNNSPSELANRRRRSLAKYGLTPDDYEDLLRRQSGVCAICHQPERSLANNGNIKNLAVDHCHVTLVVRGLLCANCNKGIGNLGDSPDRLRSAALYLEAPHV